VFQWFWLVFPSFHPLSFSLSLLLLFSLVFSIHEILGSLSPGHCLDPAVTGFEVCPGCLGQKTTKICLKELLAIHIFIPNKSSSN
jgi:hypothetical protein